MKELARQGVILERIYATILDIEVDLCMMEHDVDFSVRRWLRGLVVIEEQH